MRPNDGATDSPPPCSGCGRPVVGYVAKPGVPGSPMCSLECARDNVRPKLELADATRPAEARVTERAITPTMRAVLLAFGERSFAFANDLPASRSVLYKMRDAGLITMIPHHRETSVGITEAGRVARA